MPQAGGGAEPTRASRQHPALPLPHTMQFPAVHGQERLSLRQGWVYSLSPAPSPPLAAGFLSPTSPSRPVRPALALCSQWCQASGEPMARLGVPKQGWGMVFHRTNCSQEGKKPEQIENSEVNVPCRQSCVKCVSGKRTPHFSLNLHLNTMSPHVAACSAVLSLAPQAVMLQQTIFFFTIISQIFCTPGKFLQPHITCCCKQ